MLLKLLNASYTSTALTAVDRAASATLQREALKRTRGGQCRSDGPENVPLPATGRHGAPERGLGSWGAQIVMLLHSNKFSCKKPPVAKPVILSRYI